MAALIITVIILAVILLLPVGADASVWNGGAKVRVKAGALGFTVLSLPREDRPKKPKKAKKPEKEQKQKAQPAEKPKKKLAAADILGLVRLGLRALGRLRKRLSVDLLEAHITCGGDPYDAALSYGRISAAVCTLVPLLERVLKIRDRDISVDIDFDRPDFDYSARLILTIQIWEVLYIGLAFLYGFLKMRHSHRKETKLKERTEQNGKPDKRASGRYNVENEGYGGRQHNRRGADNLA